MGFSIPDLKSIFDRPKPDSAIASNGSTEDLESYLSKGAEGTYSLERSNWYTAKPYGFKTTGKDDRTITMFLPISPSNLTISTNFATNIIPTLYGTVEEHSEVRYFDIVIEGTTGMAPRFVTPYVGKPADAFAKAVRPGRSTAEVAANITGAFGGFFSKTLNTINNVFNKATDLAGGGPKPKNGVMDANSGYVAFHNLYRFLLQYKRDAAGISNSGGTRKVHPLTFFNYKDNNEYDVVVRSFSMRRSADNPMLYHYSIQLRGYNLRSLKDKIDENYKLRLQELGLNGVDSSSVLGDIKSVAKDAKSVIGSFIGGINILGR